MTALTQKQNAILDFIRDHTAQQGYSPTMQEICNAFGIKSKNAVYKHLIALKKKGYLLRGAKGTARTFRVASSAGLQKKIERLAVLGLELAEHDALSTEKGIAAKEEMQSITDDYDVLIWLNNSKKLWQQELLRSEQ